MEVWNHSNVNFEITASVSSGRNWFDFLCCNQCRGCRQMLPTVKNCELSFRQKRWKGVMTANLVSASSTPGSEETWTRSPDDYIQPPTASSLPHCITPSHSPSSACVSALRPCCISTFHPSNRSAVIFWQSFTLLFSVFPSSLFFWLPALSVNTHVCHCVQWLFDIMSVWPLNTLK